MWNAPIFVGPMTLITPLVLLLVQVLSRLSLPVTVIPVLKNPYINPLSELVILGLGTLPPKRPSLSTLVPGTLGWTTLTLMLGRESTLESPSSFTRVHLGCRWLEQLLTSNPWPTSTNSETADVSNLHLVPVNLAIALQLLPPHNPRLLTP